ncbi:MAG: DNA-binding protein [Anaerolineales bacterium]|nr:MAG: DNA-binding protein [Anaerolineales bacterium]
MAEHIAGSSVRPEEQLMTTQDVAARLKVSTQTVRRWIKEHNPERKLPAIRVGPRMWRVSPSELERWLQQRSTGRTEHCTDV